MKFSPIAFMSYVREDDRHDGGRLSMFRERLSGEVRMQTGEAFDIFQDREDIKWGEQWKVRIEGALDSVSLLIPIITPAFFKRLACRQELERFLERERALRRTELILPVYYVDCPVLNDEEKRADDPLAQAIAQRQYMDWRALRFESLSSPEVRKKLAEFGQQIVEALDRNRLAGPVSCPAPLDAGAVAGTTASDAAQKAVSKHAGRPVLIVDPASPEHYRTLGEAIEAAAPRSLILVRAGLYRESIVLDKPVEIVGDGDKQEIVIEASGQSIVEFKSCTGRIAHLTLRQTGGGQSFGVDISTGKLELVDCDISSQSLACVAIHGGAEPVLRGNLIHDGNSSGIVVYEGGKGTLEDNEICRNEAAGVEIKQGGNPTLRRNRIHHGRSCGVLVDEGGIGTLEDNDIFTNTEAGVVVKQGGAPALSLNRIHCGKGGGVVVTAGGTGTFEDNDIYGNTYAGVAISDGANPALRRNRIRDGAAAGVYVYNNGRGILEDNEIFGNAHAGVETKDGGNPTVLRNQISRNRHGIRISESGDGRFDGNSLHENRLGAWDIATKMQGRSLAS